MEAVAKRRTLYQATAEPDDITVHRKSLLDQKAATTFWRKRGLMRPPNVRVVPKPTPEQSLMLDTCFRLTTADRADLLVLLDEKSAGELVGWRSHGTSFLLPVVDMTRGGVHSCDITFKANDPTLWSEVAATIVKFATRRSQLTQLARGATDLEARLLAYLYVADKPLIPFADPTSQLFIRYPGFFPERELRGVAESLSKRGMLTRSFVDRYHACAACGSHRLNVREECLSCRSAQLSEVALIHHFRCAELDTEDAFRAGTDLRCPKCRQQLRHYGSDYDKPGSVLRCAACHSSNSEPAVGFSCQDCGAHTDGEAAPTCDIHSYALTAKAIARLITPDSQLTKPRRALPHAVEEEIARLSDEVANAVAVIRYGRRERVIGAHGEIAFGKLRSLFVENLRNLIVESGRVVAGDEADYLILEDTEADELVRHGACLLEQCEAVLAERIGPELDVLRIDDRIVT